MMREKKGHAISGVFVFLLLGLFAVFGTLLVLLGSQAYRGIVERTSTHNESRIMSSFVRHAVRAEDTAGTIEVKTLEDRPVLCIGDNYGYVSYLYVHEGCLYELYTEPGDEFKPDRGEVICEGTQSFEASIDGQRLTVVLTDEGGEKHESCIVLYSGEVSP